MILLLLALLGVAVAGLWTIRRRMRPKLPPTGLSLAVGVRSEITAAGDSLDVVVSWRLTEPTSAAPADSVRIEVGLGNAAEPRIHLMANARSADTVRIPGPGAGQTATGYSCVAGVHGMHLSRETCTPWQYVRPGAQAPSAPVVDTPSGAPTKKQAVTPAAATVVRIVVQPEGQQVDPDLGGRCAAWQQRNPGRQVWIEVNLEAVPECMGPNGRPTVAQFCAFALLADGRRVKTVNSSNNSYCDRLYQEWVRQRTT
ncbi:MAG: hypothetical protein ABJC36_08055 [Gemmatimonadales bacterium]